MSKNIVFEGWLTKSPPTKRIWRTKWRRRWFALRHTGELPGQYFLDYYADRHCRRLKGTINLDLCEQVDAGLHMERSGSGSLDPKLRGSVFTIQTQSRTYHLEADCEAEMEKWVDAICSVCGLRATEDTSTENGTYRNNTESMALNERPDGPGPYIRISECITGPAQRNGSQDSRAFTFDTQNVVRSTRGFAAPGNRGNRMYLSQPLRQQTSEFSENESNLSEDDSKSLNAGHSNMGEWSVTKSFTKLAVSPKKNGVSEDGPPVPPRPPKTLGTLPRSSIRKDAFLESRNNEPIDSADELFSHRGVGPSLGAIRKRSPARPPPVDDDDDDLSPGHPSHRGVGPSLGAIRKRSPARPPPVDDDDDDLSPGHPLQTNLGVGPSLGAIRKRSPARPPPFLGTTVCVTVHAEDDQSPGHPSMQYCNVSSLPPAVDRKLKPRPTSHTTSLNISHLHGNHPALPPAQPSEVRADTLQYLDLDLSSSTSSLKTQPQIPPGNKTEATNGKSLSEVDDDADCYKTVDFLKTEAFNITMQDAEASRSHPAQHLSVGY